jgi:hypothetical protein
MMEDAILSVSPIIRHQTDSGRLSYRKNGKVVPVFNELSTTT